MTNELKPSPLCGGDAHLSHEIWREYGDCNSMPRSTDSATKLQSENMDMNEVDHLLACLAEESGEVAQMVGKCLRFGLANCHPKTGNLPNKEMLRREFNDLYAVAEMLGLSIDPVLVEAKKAKVKKYMQYVQEM